MVKEKFDLVIVGAGIAGISSAIYAKRAGLSTVIFEKTAIGGQLLFMEQVDNYVGIKLGTKGSELVNELSDTVKKLELDLRYQEIEKISNQDNCLVVTTSQGEYQTQSLIVATGASFKTLGVKGENLLTGKGVSYCAICDGFFFRNKDVAVIGGGNTAVEEALYLSNICRKVYLIHRRDKLRAINYLQDQLLSKENVEVVYNAQVNEICGKDFVQDLVVKESLSGNTKIIKVDGVFVAIGVIANTVLVSKLVDCDESGFILTDGEMQTSVKSIWACGDCRNRPLRQLVTAASEGAIAAISAYRLVKGHYISA